jgi:hypothetical protein
MNDLTWIPEQMDANMIKPIVESTIPTSMTGLCKLAYLGVTVPEQKLSLHLPNLLMTPQYRPQTQSQSSNKNYPLNLVSQMDVNTINCGT